MVLGGTPTNTNLSEAVLPLGMSRWATTYALAHLSDRLAGSGRQAVFDQAIDALAEHLDATRHELTDYGQRRRALADWSIPATDWARLTDGLPTRLQTSTWRWRHLPWDDRKRVLASVWIWYHATHGDRAYNAHMRRDWTDSGRLNPTAKHVSNRWRALTTRDGLYQPLFDRLDTHLTAITRTIDSGAWPSGEATAPPAGVARAVSGPVRAAGSAVGDPTSAPTTQTRPARNTRTREPSSTGPPSQSPVHVISVKPATSSSR
jgi:hypothetical protein